jgi:hypothetical protein
VDFDVKKPVVFAGKRTAAGTVSQEHYDFIVETSGVSRHIGCEAVAAVNSAVQ